MVEHDHTPEAIRERLEDGTLHSYTRDWVYGGIDGSVTTFAVVVGVIGEDLSPAIVLVIGMANILVDGFSVAASNFLGTRTEHEELSRLEAIEHRHIERDPEGEREESIDAVLVQQPRRIHLEAGEIEHHRHDRACGHFFDGRSGKAILSIHFSSSR